MKIVITKGRNRRWEEVEKDSIELSALARHFELYNRTEGKSPENLGLDCVTPLEAGQS